jgi:hypothetical protein
MRFSFILFFLFPLLVFAQTETVVTGKIQDKRTKEALPYVSMGFKGVPGGTTSNFEGRFKISTTKPTDSLFVTYMGYKKLGVKIKRNQTQTLLIELEEQTLEMNEAIVRPGLNPALRIVNGARKNKGINTQENLDAYEYDSYSKLDLSLTNVSDEMRNNPILKPLQSLFDTLNQMKNQDGKHILPALVSETFSKYYYNKSPVLTKEQIEGSRYSGIGIEKNSYLTDLMGGELHHYNLYGNYLRILNKDFISPIADAAHTFYIYTLLDSTENNGVKTYKIQLNLKRKQDLGFEGLIWIEDSSYALTKVDLFIGKESNVNFINKIKLQQEWAPTSAGPWITSRSRIVFDFARISKAGSGVLAGFYNAYSNFVINKKRPEEFFDYAILTNQDAGLKDTSFWSDKRSEPLSNIEKEMFLKVDSVNNLPIMKTYVDVIHTIVEGYRRIGKLDWGPYMNLISFNQVEGTRLRVGFKTNYDFHQKFVFNTYLAYGINDKRFKYQLGFDYILDDKMWTKFSMNYRDDYDLLGISNSPISSISTGGIFQFFNFFSGNARMNSTQELKVDYTKSFKKYFSCNVSFINASFNPVGRFAFAYLADPVKGMVSENISDRFVNSSFGLEVRWAYREKMISRGHDRFNIETAKAPVVVLSYQQGFKGVMGSDFNFNRVNLTVTQHLNTGILGTADWWIYGGKVFGVLPYPMLDVARGNESIIYSDYNYSLMNFYEFISDEYLHAAYVQRFEGLLLNRIPWVKDLKWRNVMTVKAAYGQLSSANKNKMSQSDVNGNPVISVHSFDRGPYVEMGYGIENIFKVFSVGLFHRLNYHELPNSRKWALNLGLRVQF